MRRSTALTLTLLLAYALTTALPAGARTYNPNLFGGLHWRLIGPFRAGRALAVTGVPNHPDRFYFGAVGGGVWETPDAGRTWHPIFDKEPVASIGAIAVAPSDSKIIYVGSGEADMRSDIQQGDGMYKSTDGGKTWSRIGLTDTQQIGDIVIDPKNPQIVYVAALGHPYGPNTQRGVFKTIDGGATWSRVLYKNEKTGAIDLAMDPSNSNVIFAALWQTRRPPWSVYPPSNGPGSGLYKTTDAGKTWTQIVGHGFPGGIVGRIGVSISPAMPNRIYAIVDTNNAKTGGVYRSDDGGATWTYADGEMRIWTRGWYFGGITADPKNPDEVYVMNTSTYRSTDGGKSFIPIKGAPGGDDYHTLWIEPNDPSRMILGSDQGVVVSVDDAKTWSSWYNQPTGQFYDVATDNRFPYWVYGSQQDSGAMAVPSRTIHTGISFREWQPMDVGGESGTVAADPLHPGLIFGSASDGGPAKQILATGWQQNIDPAVTHPGKAWRSTWTLPMVFSAADPHLLYYSHQRIFRSTDGGASWHIISPDLTRKLTPRRGVIYAIAPSPLRAATIWAGTDDGLIWLTRDGGAHWRNVTPPELTPWSKVGIIDASHFDANSAYAAIDRHRLSDNRPYIYKTHDGGKHWSAIVTGLPANQWVNVVREDPQRRGLLYAGTERGVFVSFDDGAHWQSLQLNLPAASVRDITFRDGDIIIATHGRAFWILDDASPLRQLSSRIADAPAALFKPEQAVLFQTAPSFGGGTADEGTPLPPEEPQGKNPPYGAMLDYYIGNASTPVTLSISNARGRVVRRYSSAQAPPKIDYKRLNIPAYWIHPVMPPQATPGAHRFVWNLRDGDARGPLVPPGRYTVSMNVNGKTYREPLTVVADPRDHASAADLRAQYEFARTIRSEIAVVQAAQKRALKAGDRNLVGAGFTAFAGTPDEGGTPPNDFHSLAYFIGALQGLYGAVESAPAAPTAAWRRTFSQLKQEVAGAMRQLP